MSITNQDGGDRVPTRGQELVDSAPKCQLVADEAKDGNASVDLSEEELTKGPKSFAAVEVQLSSDVHFNPQVHGVITIEANGLP